MEKLYFMGTLIVVFIAWLIAYIRNIKEINNIYSEMIKTLQIIGELIEVNNELYECVVCLCGRLDDKEKKDE